MYNETDSGLKPGDKVTHSIFGDGVVVSVTKDLATIAFSYKVGVKTIEANHKYLTKR
jgi:DNA helicase-2/ATP-dependent DNA helicase PcrA